MKVREIKEMDRDLIKSYQAFNFPKQITNQLPSHGNRYSENNNQQREHQENRRLLQISGSVEENQIQIPSLIQNEPNKIQQHSDHEIEPKRFSAQKLNMNNNSLPQLNLNKYGEEYKGKYIIYKNI